MNYKEKLSAEQLLKLNNVLADLPEFCKDYFDECQNQDKSAATILEYAYDIRAYFNYLVKKNPMIHSIQDISLDILDHMTPRDIQEYMSYLRSHENDKGKLITTNASARSRKLSSLRSFYQYYFAYASLSSNPAKLVDLPSKKIKKQPRLDTEEMQELLMDTITGDTLDKKKKPYAKRSNMRDIAIIALLGGTGIRVSELVGIDIDDIDWKHRCVRVIRKGGDEADIYFGEEINRYLIDYIKFERNPLDDAEKALFVASRGERGRLTVRSVERVVAKYSSATFPAKKISPHSLRRSFGTQYYASSSDIYAVADALGHKNIQVTKDHYADISDEKKRQVKGFSDNLLGRNRTYVRENNQDHQK